jgi:hypothetical protein
MESVNIKKTGSCLALISGGVGFIICMIGFIFAFSPQYIHLDMLLFSFALFVLIPLTGIGALLIFLGARKTSKG